MYIKKAKSKLSAEDAVSFIKKDCKYRFLTDEELDRFNIPKPTFIHDEHEYVDRSNVGSSNGYEEMVKERKYEVYLVYTDEYNDALESVKRAVKEIHKIPTLRGSALDLKFFLNKYVYK